MLSCEICFERKADRDGVCNVCHGVYDAVKRHRIEPKLCEGCGAEFSTEIVSFEIIDDDNGSIIEVCGACKRFDEQESNT